MCTVRERDRAHMQDQGWGGKGEKEKQAPIEQGAQCGPHPRITTVNRI